MTSKELLAIESAVALATIWVLLLELWPSYRLDAFRQAMFAVRDELFDYAATQAISFEHPAYRLLRRAMNGFIRYGHQLTLFRLLCNLMVWHGSNHKPAFEWATEWEKALETVPNEGVKNTLQKFQACMLHLVVKKLVLGSPFLLSLLAFTLVSQVLQSHWNGLRQLLRRS